MKRIAFHAAMALALETPFICAARTLSVSAPDGSGNVTVTIGGTGTGDQQLIAAWANGDKGTNPTNWMEYADAGTVAAADTSKSYQLPAAWRAKSGAVRFFLMSGMPPYKTRYDYITRPGVQEKGGLYIETGVVPDKTIDITVKSAAGDDTSMEGMIPFGSTNVFMMTNSGNDNRDRYFFAFLGVVHPGLDNPTVTTLGRSDTNVFGEQPPKSTDPHTYRMCRDGIYIDGYRHLGPFDDSELTAAPTDSLVLFDRKGRWGSTWKQCSIYFATIVTNGVIARDYVPCKNFENRVTMYDRVTHSFGEIAGSLKSSRYFAAGNDIGPYPPDCGTVDGVSDAVGLGPAIAVTGTDWDTHSVNVSISSGHDDGLLFAVAGASDAGETYSSWTTNMLVSKVGAGTNCVTVALPRGWWHGKYVRFAWRSLAGRPYDYDVSYIHADHTGGDNFCRTGWKPTTNTTIHANVKTALDVAPFGVMGCFNLHLNGTSSENSAFFYVYGKEVNSGGYRYPNVNTFVANYHDWRLGPTGARVDDTVIGTYSNAKPVDGGVTANICLPFRASSTKDHTSVTKAGNAEVKFAKIWEGDILVRDFVPCVSTNGVPGFYDNVKGGFYPSVNASKPFVAGDIVVADSDFVSWSSVRKLGKGFFITFR